MLFYSSVDLSQAYLNLSAWLWNMEQLSCVLKLEYAALAISARYPIGSRSTSQFTSIHGSINHLLFVKILDLFLSVNPNSISSRLRHLITGEIRVSRNIETLDACVESRRGARLW
jgi:hypothetical protein